MRNLIVLAVVALMVPAGSVWGDTVWTDTTPAGDTWFDDTNWSAGEPDPAGETTARIENGYTALVDADSGGNPRLAWASAMYVGTATGAGNIVISMGDFSGITINNGLDNKYFELGYDNAGVVTLNGAHRVWHSSGVGSEGEYYLQSGQFQHWRGFGIAGWFEQTGGLLNQYNVGSLNITDGGTYKISGGTLNANDNGMSVGAGGTFHIVGDSATITVPGPSGYTQAGTLIAEVNGISIIEVTDLATLTDGVIDMEGAPTLYTQYTLLTADYLVGLPTLKDEDAIGGSQWGANYWTLQTNVGTDDENIDAYVKVTYVPEPATLAMLGAGCLGVLLRRRKQ